jgi:O-ureido-D-serine cyclo-ligase
MKVRIALVSAREALALDEDMAPLVAALRTVGAEVDTPLWDDPAVAWDSYSVAVLRSTWDYVDRIDEFLAWTDRCSRATQLMNPPEVIRWNTDKHYLIDLARSGVPVVPTTFVEPHGDAHEALDRFLTGGEEAGSVTVGGRQGFDEFVVKPAIGAGSRDAARFGRAEAARAVAHLRALLDAGRSTMLQPYLSRVDEQGETAVIYLDGTFSHAARKGPLLRAGDALVEGLFAPEEISAREADRSELEVADAAYRAIGSARPVYARIDLIRDADNRPVVLELELTEPSLFLLHAPGAALRYARILAARAADSLPRGVAGSPA